jgi:hypothetical protein
VQNASSPDREVATNAMRIADEEPTPSSAANAGEPARLGRWQGVGALAVTGLVGLGLMTAAPQFALFWLLLMIAVVVRVAARSRVSS